MLKTYNIILILLIFRVNVVLNATMDGYKGASPPLPKKNL